MARGFKVGEISEVEVRAERSALLGALILWSLAYVGFTLAFDLPPLSAALAAGVYVALHWFLLAWHHLGHALAARSTGYPMSGLHISGLLASDRYPSDEPPLPAGLHARRALGGPVASLVLTAVLAGLGWWLKESSPLLRLGPWILAAENVLVFILGALLPLGFTDGSTLLNLWRWGSPQPPES